MILELVDEAVAAGARQGPACDVLGLSERCLQRWREQEVGDDERQGPKAAPKNKLSEVERKRVLDVVNWPEYRALSPKQIVPLLADQGEYIASESSVYRILRNEKQLRHRERSRPRRRHKPHEHRAHGPLEVWTWDITYLRSAVRGEFYYLYMVVDSCEALGYVESRPWRPGVLWIPVPPTPHNWTRFTEPQARRGSRRPVATPRVADRRRRARPWRALPALFRGRRRRSDWLSRRSHGRASG